MFISMVPKFKVRHSAIGCYLRMAGGTSCYGNWSDAKHSQVFVEPPHLWLSRACATGLLKTEGQKLLKLLPDALMAMEDQAFSSF